jgi:hypothetical protein
MRVLKQVDVNLAFAAALEAVRREVAGVAVREQMSEVRRGLAAHTRPGRVRSLSLPAAREVAHGPGQDTSAWRAFVTALGAEIERVDAAPAHPWEELAFAEEEAVAAAGLREFAYKLGERCVLLAPVAEALLEHASEGFDAESRSIQAYMDRRRSVEPDRIQVRVEAWTLYAVRRPSLHAGEEPYAGESRRAVWVRGQWIDALVPGAWARILHLTELIYQGIPDHDGSEIEPSA